MLDLNILTNLLNITIIISRTIYLTTSWTSASSPPVCPLRTTSQKLNSYMPWPPSSSHQTFLLLNNPFRNWYNIQFGHWVFAKKNLWFFHHYLISHKFWYLCSLKSIFLGFNNTTFIRTLISFYLDCWNFNLFSKYLLNICHVSGTTQCWGTKMRILVFLEFTF